jgi:hypothetical protein
MSKKLTEYGGFQGDVSIVPVSEFPNDAQPTKNRIVAYGEATGHHHSIRGNVDMRETGEAFYFTVVGEEPVVITHIGGEHEDIEILPGIIWRVAKVAQVEYDGAQERKMRD